jgi:hypothetical protein
MQCFLLRLDDPLVRLKRGPGSVFDCLAKGASQERIGGLFSGHSTDQSQSEKYYRDSAIQARKNHLKLIFKYINNFK